MDTEFNEEALEKEMTSLIEMRDRMGREDGTWMDIDMDDGRGRGGTNITEILKTKTWPYPKPRLGKHPGCKKKNS